MIAWFYVQLGNFSLMWRQHHYRWRASIFLLYSTLMAIEHWGLFSLPHLLYHGTSVYNGHLRGPISITSAVEHLEVELPLPVYIWLWSVSTAWGFEHPTFPMRGERLTDCATAAVHYVRNKIFDWFLRKDISTTRMLVVFHISDPLACRKRKIHRLPHA